MTFPELNSSNRLDSCHDEVLASLLSIFRMNMHPYETKLSFSFYLYWNSAHLHSKHKFHSLRETSNTSLKVRVKFQTTETKIGKNFIYLLKRESNVAAWWSHASFYLPGWQASVLSLKCWITTCCGSTKAVSPWPLTSLWKERNRPTNPSEIRAAWHQGSKSVADSGDRRIFQEPEAYANWTQPHIVINAHYTD